MRHLCIPVKESKWQLIEVLFFSRDKLQVSYRNVWFFSTYIGCSFIFIRKQKNSKKQFCFVIVCSVEINEKNEPILRWVWHIRKTWKDVKSFFMQYKGKASVNKVKKNVFIRYLVSPAYTARGCDLSLKCFKCINKMLFLPKAINLPPVKKVAHRNYKTHFKLIT